MHRLDPLIARTTETAPGRIPEVQQGENLFLILDYERNAESSNGRGSNPKEGLRDQLVRILETHPCGLANAQMDGRDLLRNFFGELFPDGLPAWVLLSNVSLDRNLPVICMRHREIGPRLAELVPAGVAFAVSGHIWQAGPYNARQATLVISRIRAMPQAPARRFESEAHVFVSHYRRDSIPQARSAPANVLSEERVQALPLISIETSRRLADWRDYLDWKEKLIKSRINGVRYVSAEFDAKGEYRFLCIGRSEEDLVAAQRLFRSDDLQPFPLEYSSDPWIFAFNEREKTKTAKVLGDLSGTQTVSRLPPKFLYGCPWPEPAGVWVRFRLDDDAQNELDKLLSDSSDEAEIRDQFLRRVSQDGYLALSAIGDLSVVGRQRRELRRLEEQASYAPFLTSYLFDIKAANVPTTLTAIADEEWMRKDLNEDQKLAVRMMISTPDLGLIQGPPGTGKTTMIAEAAYQFVKRGMKVLVASQANLAVDNVLERLSATPYVRAVRLGKRGEIDNPFSQAKTLGTYYQTLAAACCADRLDLWSKSESEHERLVEWLKQVGIVRADWERLTSDVSSLQEAIDAGAAQVDRLEADLEACNMKRRSADDARAWVECIRRGDDWSGTLPDSVLAAFHDNVAMPLSKLAQLGISANTIWTQRDYGTPAQRSQFARAIMSRWFAVESFIGHLKGDLERLQATAGESVMSADDEVELGRLRQEEVRLRDALADDESRLPEWQRIRVQIKERERTGSGLDSASYQKIFDGQLDGRQAHLQYVSPGTAKDVVVARLESTLEAIVNCRRQVHAGIELLASHVDGLFESLQSIANPDQQVRAAKGQLGARRSQLQEAVTAAAAKRARLEELLALRSSRALVGGEFTTATIESAMRAAQQDLAALGAQLEASAAERKVWRPILEKWVADLRDPPTVRNDEQLFQDAFIRSCNVIGVTCNEKRETLEEYGHAHFDVAIVDEVSKATPVEIVMPLMMARTGLLVGDHRQLPPLFREDGSSLAEIVAEQDTPTEDARNRDPAATELTEENLERFRRQVTASLFKEHFENAPSELKAFLLTQYRMHPSIMSVVNRFYENRLICGLRAPHEERRHNLELVSETGSKYLLSDQHVLWIDSTTDPLGGDHHERHDVGTSKCNDLEALLIARSLVDLDSALQAQGFGQGSEPRKQVGVITFYGRQVKVIRQYVDRLNKSRGGRFVAINYDVNTVDRYQGQERPIVYVSLVRNPPWRLSARANTAQFERINVAFSRAQELLIIVGAARVFSHYPVKLPRLECPGTVERNVYADILSELQRDRALLNSRYIISAGTYRQLIGDGRGDRGDGGQKKGST